MEGPMSHPIEYVRKCPRCGHRNAESRDTCAIDGCGEFLGLEPAVPASDAAEPAHNAQVSSHAEPSSVEEPGAPAERHRAPAPLLFLEAPGFGVTFAVRDGATVGRAGPGSGADVQLSGLPALNHVHRRHCRFEQRDDRWHCTALDEGSFSPPNPTLVNGETLSPGEVRPIDDGDRVSLASTHLVVRIP